MRDVATIRIPAIVVLAVYAMAVLAGAALVFLVQPLAARMLLPKFGGSPAVWTTSLLFFQLALLLGYGWAHLSTTRLTVGRQPVAQLALLATSFLVLPFTLPAWTTPPTGTEPATWLLLVLVAMIGLPYVAVTTASPVLQRWFTQTNHPHAVDPYFLYAMGNAGSLMGLLAYPFIIEPNLALRDQVGLWSVGYFAFVILSASAVLIARLARAPVAGIPPVPAVVDIAATRVPAPQPTVRRRAGWVAMAFVPSSLMLGVTTFISADLAAVPLLWVVPLSLYLATFMIAFSPRNPITPRRLGAILPLVVVALAAVLVGAVQPPLAGVVVVNLLAFFVAALLSHVRLAADRPPARYLTEFYLLLAVGGALGGLFNAILAPAVFDSVLEYPLAITLALMLRPGRAAASELLERRSRRLDLIVPAAVFVLTLALLALQSRAFGPTVSALPTTIGLIALVTLVFVRRPLRFGASIGSLLLIPLLVGQGSVFVDRGFFGVNRVVDQGDIRLLIHGTTTHGGQLKEPGRAREPLTYYHLTGPFGRTMSAFLASRPSPVKIGVVGLGAGGIAAYVRPGDSITFFEIDPIVARIAEDPSLFTFLSGSPGPVYVVLGDGRQTLARTPAGSFDVLVLDAFSGDSPPTHLLTVEAIDLYLRALRPGGVLLFNVSNRYVDLERVVVTGLRSLGLPARIPVDPDPTTPSAPEKELSGWVLSARSARDLGAISRSIRTIDPPVTTSRPWTDDFSDLISAIHWVQ